MRQWICGASARSARPTICTTIESAATRETTCVSRQYTLRAETQKLPVDLLQARGGFRVKDVSPAPGEPFGFRLSLPSRQFRGERGPDTRPVSP
jgi:hypothetical protein